MGNTTTKRPDEHGGLDSAHGMGNIDVGSPMDDSGFIFPGQTETPLEKVPAVIRWKGGGKEVFVSGSYDNWQTKLPLARSHDDFVGIVDLPAGNHEYKFLVDGHWKISNNEPSRQNEMGTLNNVLEVKPSDFEVFEALALDSLPDTKIRGGSGTTTPKKSELDLSHSPPGKYSQEIPQSKLEDSRVHPPTLPPHLLNKVLLNQDVDLSCEPSLLPEPQHVMLNHMYALSIKDGVMALSATHRYKKKFVTTLLYKPFAQPTKSA